MNDDVASRASTGEVTLEPDRCACTNHYLVSVDCSGHRGGYLLIAVVQDDDPLERTGRDTREVLGGVLQPAGPSRGRSNARDERVAHVMSP